MRIVLVALALVVLAAGPASAANQWTLLFYLVGDDTNSSGTEDAAIGDLDILAEKGPAAGVTYLAQVDRGTKLSQTMRERYREPNYSGAVRYRPGKDSWGTVAKIGEVNSGDPQALLDFVRWGMKEAPAERYMLIVSSHGSGALSWRGVGSTSGALPGEVRLNPFVGYDDTDNDCLTIFEIAKVLDAVKADRGGKKLEVLGFDACSAGAIEALYQFREGCEVIVASPSTIPISGFAYRKTLAALSANTAITPEALASELVKGFIDAQDSGSQVMGAFRTSAADELAGALDRLSIEMVRAQKQVGGMKLGNLSKYGDKGYYWDLKRIAERIVDPATDMRGAANAEAMRQAARDVLEARKNAVVSLWYMGSFNDDKVGGLSIYWPDKADHQKYRAFYKALGLSRATHWDEFLDLRELGISAD
jgi:hypothetical protein